MPTTVAGDRTATRVEVIPRRAQLRELAAVEGLTDPRIDATGTVIVHSDAPGYGPLRRFATSASRLVGVWVNVVTDDVPAAQVPADAL